jgi:hypothetical protein
MPEAQMHATRHFCGPAMSTCIKAQTDKTRTVGIPWVYELSEGGDGDACGHLRGRWCRRIVSVVACMLQHLAIYICARAGHLLIQLYSTSARSVTTDVM